MADPTGRGWLFGFGAYLTWGLFPLYWPLLEPANAVEILAHRVIWTLVVVLVLIWRLHRWQSLQAVLADRRRVALLSAGAVAVSVNWGLYIWAVNDGQVLPASLGYFVTPLFSIVVGVVVLHERLRRLQWVAVSVASVAIIVLAVDDRQLPWIALTLATSFTLYSFIKKTADVGAIESLTVETGVLSLPALGTLIVLQAQGTLAFAHHGAGNAALLAGAGVVTAIPLLLFTGAARRLPLSQIGLIQYVTPVMQFLLGVLVDHEQMSASRWAGFALVWVALVLLGVDSLPGRRDKPAGSPPATVTDQPVRSSTV